MPLDRNDPEVKALIEEATTEATEALSAKNSELIAELRKANAKLKKGTEIDPEEHARLQTEVDELTAKLDHVTKDSQKTIDRLTKDVSDKDAALAQHLIDGGLSSALAKAGIAPYFVDAAKSLLKAQATIKDGVALIGEKPLDEAVTEWAATDQGKHFVSAPLNSGGASPGSTRPTVPGPKKAKDMTPDEKAAYIGEHGIEKWSEKLQTENAPAAQ